MPTAFCHPPIAYSLTPPSRSGFCLAKFPSAQTTKKDSLVIDSSSTAAKPSPNPSPAPPQSAPKAPKQSKLGKVNVNGSLRLRAESYGWFDTPGYEDSYAFGAAQLRLTLSQQREKWDWLVEGEFRLFNLLYHDGRGALKTDNRTAAARRRGQHPHRHRRRTLHRRRQNGARDV